MIATTARIISKPRAIGPKITTARILKSRRIRPSLAPFITPDYPHDISSAKWSVWVGNVSDAGRIIYLCPLEIRRNIGKSAIIALEKVAWLFGLDRSRVVRFLN